MNFGGRSQASTCLVLVGYTPAQTLAALDFCNRLFFWVPRRQRIMTANCPDLLRCNGIVRRLRGWRLTLGSNLQHEFSGWQEGLDVLRPEMGDGFGAILLNDTVNSHRNFSLPRRAAFLASTLQSPASGLVGFTNRLAGGAPFTIDGEISRGWISTYLLYLGAEALSRVGHRVWYPELNEICVPGGADPGTFFSEAVSENLRSHLCRWLFERGWYGSESLRDSNAAAFTIKARSIVNEILLSIRARHPVCGLTDPFEQYPRLGQWDSRLKRWRMTLADFGSGRSGREAASASGTEWRLR
ncbi:MAG: hypothetical protein JJT88_19010 [Gammaproteobacteria bacterium]|nr:hypothetical protein [Gammaproteobacteria bacterium]